MRYNKEITFEKAFLEPSDVTYALSTIFKLENNLTQSKYEEWTDNIHGVNNISFEDIHLKYLPKMEAITGFELNPTYTFWRVSRKGTMLPIHVDRPPCEVSITINVGYSGDKIWPFYADHENKYKFMMSPGDGVIYGGTRYLHWRDRLEDDWAVQLCLHYVKKTGVLKDIPNNFRWNDLQGTPDTKDIIEYARNLDRISKKYGLVRTPTSENKTTI